MRNASGLFPFLAAGLVLLAVGCQQNQEAVDEGAPVDMVDTAETGGAGQVAGGETPPGGETAAGGDEAALGAQVYAANCATCHGESGAGDGPAGAGLQPAPQSFRDAEWKYGSDLESVKNTINNGVPGTAMIAWRGALTDAEIDAVAKHEIAFSQGGAGASAQ
ncbi:MAG: cytochrome c [Gemmatimonadota bacterium]